MDNIIFSFLHNLANQSVWLRDPVIFFAMYFPYLVIALALIFLLLHHEVPYSDNPFRQFKEKWQEILMVFVGSGVAWIVAKILKILIHTNRPFLALPEIQALFIEDGFAFPSGHATFFMALAVALFFHHKKVGYLFMFFALIIGVARVIAGVHFPVDILGGFVLGALVAYLVRKI